MADKEERIYICKTFKTDPCEICEGSGQIECAICRKKPMFDKSISRAEAIERMKNAGLKYACRANGRDIPEEVHHHYANMMEAALDALLGEKK